MTAPAVDYEDMKSGFQAPRAAALSDWAFRKDNAEFEKVVNRLRVRKWVQENPERRKEIANRYAAKPGVRARQDEQSRARRWKRFLAAGRHLVTCKECGVEFCLVFVPRGSMPRKFCTNACYMRARYQRITAGARRVKRTGGQP